MVDGDCVVGEHAIRLALCLRNRLSHYRPDPLGPGAGCWGPADGRPPVVLRDCAMRALHFVSHRKLSRSSRAATPDRVIPSSRQATWHRWSEGNRVSQESHDAKGSSAAEHPYHDREKKAE